MAVVRAPSCERRRARTRRFVATAALLGTQTACYNRLEIQPQSLRGLDGYRRDAEGPGPVPGLRDVDGRPFFYAGQELVLEARAPVGGSAGGAGPSPLPFDDRVEGRFARIDVLDGVLTGTTGEGRSVEIPIDEVDRGWIRSPDRNTTVAVVVGAGVIAVAGLVFIGFASKMADPDLDLGGDSGATTRR